MSSFSRAENQKRNASSSPIKTSRGTRVSLAPYQSNPHHFQGQPNGVNHSGFSLARIPVFPESGLTTLLQPLQRLHADDEQVQVRPLTEAEKQIETKESDNEELAARRKTLSEALIEQNQPGARIEAAKSGGRAIDEDARRILEPELGADLSRVRIHADAEADRLSHMVHAAAFTTGTHIFFRAGMYRPASEQGRHLLAHEATHVIQQAAGPVTAAFSIGNIAISEPNDRFEQAAEVNADRIARSLHSPLRGPIAFQNESIHQTNAPLPVPGHSSRPLQRMPIIQRVTVKDPDTQKEVELEKLSGDELERILLAAQDPLVYSSVSSEIKDRRDQKIKRKQRKASEEYSSAKKELKGELKAKKKKLKKGDLTSKEEERIKQEIKDLKKERRSLKESRQAQKDKESKAATGRLSKRDDLRYYLRKANILESGETFYFFEEPVRRHWIRRVTGDDLRATRREITTVSGDNMQKYTQAINDGKFKSVNGDNREVHIETSDGREFGSSHKTGSYPRLYPISGPTCTNLSHEELEALVDIRNAKEVNDYVTKNHKSADINAALAALTKAGIAIK